MKAVTNEDAACSSSTKPTSSGTSKKRKGKSKAKKCPPPKDSKLFEFRDMIDEDHGQALYGAQFNNCLKETDPLIFATVGSNRLTVYECPDDGSIQLLQCYADEDENENFYTCAWSYEPDTGGDPILAAAGLHGVIRIFSPAAMDCTKTIIGHTGAVDELKFHPREPLLLFSASKDHSVRLWNVRTEALVAIFGGFDGHHSEVISCDVDPDGSKLYSGAMDRCIKIWDLDKAVLNNAIAQSHNFNVEQAGRHFETVQEHYPEFTTRNNHLSYVDCVRWFGEFVLSRSPRSNRIVCWEPTAEIQQQEDQGDGSSDSEKADSEVDVEEEENPSGNEESILEIINTKVVNVFPVTDCNSWFCRFSLDCHHNYIALGSDKGETFVWELNPEGKPLTLSVLTQPRCKSIIRQTTFSRYRNVLICVCDDASIWRWDKSQ